MKIYYESVTDKIELEVSEKWGKVVVDLDHQEYNVNHKETRRHCSLEAYNLDGNLLPSGINVESEVMENDDQRELIRAIFFEGISVSEYAKEKGISQPDITQRKNTVLKKLKNFYLDLIYFSSRGLPLERQNDKALQKG